MAVWLLLACAPAVAAERVALYGSAVVASPELSAALQAGGFAVAPLDDAALRRLDTLGAALVIIASDRPCPPDSRPALERFLRQRGSVFVLGPAAFDHRPQPVRGVSAVDLATPAASEVLQPKARGPNERYPVEPTRVSRTTAPGGDAAVAFRTYLRGMNDTFLRFPVASVRRADRTVLTFRARGDAYADLLALRIVDTHEREWLSFVPLAPGWRDHAVSLDDFVPRGWKDSAAPPPRLDPAAVATVSLGIDAATIWREKPMEFALARIELAENAATVAGADARLATLRWPFLAHDTHVPAGLFNPFEGTAAVAPPPGFARAWACPPPQVLHPAVQMGTDHRAEFDTQAEREQRRTPLLRNAAGDVIAEVRLLAGGPRAGATLGLFGLPPEEAVRDAALRASIVAAAQDAVRRPRISGNGCSSARRPSCAWTAAARPWTNGCWPASWIGT